MADMIYKDLYRIEVPLPDNPLKSLNSYFIKGTDRNLLVDTGFNTDVCFSALRRGLGELNADMDRTDIFLTHMHADHTGLCARMASEGSKIYISKKDEKYLLAFSDTSFWEQSVERFLKQGFSRPEIEENVLKNPMKAYSPPPNTAFSGIGDGFEIELGNYHFKALETPGHTPGHMCLYEKAHKILLCGDHIIYDITPNITSWPDVDNSLGLYLTSLRETKKLDIEAALSAHRNPIGNCRGRIDSLIDHHRKRLAEVYEIVSRRPGMTAYAIASEMKWSIRARDWTEFPTIQKWFAVGEATSHLDYLICEKIIGSELNDGKLKYYPIRQPDQASMIAGL